MSDPDPSEFAFLYFAISMLLVLMFPLTYIILSKPLKSLRLDPKYLKAPTEAKQAMALDIKRNRFYSKSSYYIYLFIWVVLILVLMNAYEQMPDAAVMRGFDPHEVLGISKLSDINQIKKAYRNLAKELHPDKHPEESELYAAKFTQLTKAYECLADPRKIPNCKKYGNPDGFQGYQVGIAMPKFISKDNEGMYLGLLFFGFITVVLVSVFSCFSQVGKYDRNGVLSSNKEYLSKRILANKHITTEGCLETIAGCEEVKGEFLDKQTSEFGPGIMYMSIGLSMTYLKKCWQQNMPKKIDELTTQIIQSLLTIPKIVQYNSKLEHHSQPQIQVELTHNDKSLKFDDLTTNDMFIIRVKLTGLRDQYIRSTTFPVLKFNQWNCILLYKNRIIDYQYAIENKSELVVNFQFIPSFIEVNPVTQFTFQLMVLADSYDLQFKQDVVLKCKAADYVKDSDSSNQDSDDESDDDDTRQVRPNKKKLD